MIIKCNKIDNISEIKWDENINSIKYTKPLYHGTTKKVLSSTNGEIVKLQECCLEICNKLIPECKKRKKDRDFIFFLNTKEMGILSGEIDCFGTPKFQYGDFYLTNDLGRAIRYSKSKSFGELGRLVSRLIVVKNKFNLLPDDKYLNDLIKYFNFEVKDYENSESVILLFNNVLYSDLLTENGNELKNYNIKDMYSYNSQLSFRLIEPIQKYSAIILNQNQYEELAKKLGYKYFKGIGYIR